MYLYLALSYAGKTTLKLKQLTRLVLDLKIKVSNSRFQHKTTSTSPRNVSL